jgi:sulfite dehydrogenase (quinone) subunit SoeB
VRYGMMIELDRCIGCLACVAACKERWDSGPEVARDWVHEVEFGRRGVDLGLTFFPGLCNHCADHPCTKECPTEATYMDARGVVVVEPELCIGCGNCVPLCPYSARFPDARKRIVEKCNFCAPYVARGEQPACVTTCLAECRHFGDLDDPQSRVAQLIAARQAAPLTTAQVQIGPKVFYAPPALRQRVLDRGVVKPTASTALTHLWQGATRPAARVVPALVAATAAFGLVANLLARRQRLQTSTAPAGQSAAQAAPGEDAEAALMPRHRLGLRFLHWFNALSWLVLLVSGTALMSSAAFALFGTSAPRWLANLVGGPAALLRLHVIWGLAWAALIVPLFLYYKRGGLEALQEIRLRRDDLRWLVQKPLVLLGRSSGPLPPQDKYNAGQKLFALSALAGTTLIIASGLVMTFHWGPPEVVRAAILLHKLAILLALVGLALHITMAAIIVEERPALRSMLSGKVERQHALHHSARWVEEHDREHAATKHEEPQR